MIPGDIVPVTGKVVGVDEVNSKVYVRLGDAQDVLRFSLADVGDPEALKSAIRDVV